MFQIKNLINEFKGEDELTINEKLDLINKYENDKIILSNKIREIFNFNPTNTIKINQNVYKDLEFFEESNIFNKINNCSTIYGERFLHFWLSNPTKDINSLKNKQNIIKNIQPIGKEIGARLNKIKNTEGNILWFWDKITDETQSLYDIIFYNTPIVGKYLNKNEFLLNITNLYKIFISPAITIFTPIVSILVPYILIKIFSPIKINIPFKQFVKLTFNNLYQLSDILKFISPSHANKAKYFSFFSTGLWLFFYLQTAYYALGNSKDTNKIINVLHNKINKVANIIRNTTEIKNICDSKNIFCKNKNDNKNKIDDNKNDNKYENEEKYNNVAIQLEYFNTLFNHHVFDNDPKLFSNKGKVLYVYNEFLQNKERLIPILEYLGEIDAYNSISNILNNNTNNYSFTKYISKNTKNIKKEVEVKNKPQIYIKGLCHPCISNSVVNNIEIGKSNKNLLITGPNKAGKSTFIKSLAVSIILSQTIGIANAKYCSLTPFSIINTYLHIPDQIGYESLFEAEMYRARDHINMLKNIDENDFAFIMMDEIFTSTNYIEGYSAAYAVANKLCKFNNSISIITTHYTNLSKLEKQTNGLIKNYKFTVKRNENNEIIYPYKIQKGISRQYIALELLKLSGFDNDILDIAIDVSKQLNNKKY